MKVQSDGHEQDGRPCELLSSGSTLVRCTSSQVSCDRQWEQAYEQFETAEQEVSKFIQRLTLLGIDSMPKSSQVVEIFCGRGNGLIALDRLGFQNIEGVDLSDSLLQQYVGRPLTLYLADCRQLPFPSQSRDMLVVQGGLHHLPRLPDDLIQTLQEVQRVLRPGGKFVMVEPYPTLTLNCIHRVVALPWVRSYSSKLNALQVMIECERTTYEAWLNRAAESRSLIRDRFVPRYDRVHWTKWMFVGEAK